MTKAIILLPFLLLAGCDSGTEVSATNASLEEVAAKVEAVRKDEDFLRPGKWVTKGRIEDVSAPGMPPELAQRMKQAGQDMPGTETCMTEADVRKPGPDFFTGNKACRYDRFTMGGGKIDAKMRCSIGGGTQITTLNGKYAPDNYQMAMATAVENPAGAARTGMEGMTMRLSVAGKRIGECTKAEYAASEKAMAEAAAAIKKIAP